MDDTVAHKASTCAFQHKSYEIFIPSSWKHLTVSISFPSTQSGAGGFFWTLPEIISFIFLKFNFILLFFDQISRWLTPPFEGTPWNFVLKLSCKEVKTFGYISLKTRPFCHNTRLLQTSNRPYTANLTFKVTQGHWLMFQSQFRIWFPISDCDLSCKSHSFRDIAPKKWKTTPPLLDAPITGDLTEICLKLSLQEEGTLRHISAFCHNTYLSPYITKTHNIHKLSHKCNWDQWWANKKMKYDMSNKTLHTQCKIACDKIHVQFATDCRSQMSSNQTYSHVQSCEKFVTSNMLLAW